jgi:hypothetical protein
MLLLGPHSTYDILLRQIMSGSISLNVEFAVALPTSEYGTAKRKVRILQLQLIVLLADAIDAKDQIVSHVLMRRIQSLSIQPMRGHSTITNKLTRPILASVERLEDWGEVHTRLVQLILSAG